MPRFTTIESEGMTGVRTPIIWKKKPKPKPKELTDGQTKKATEETNPAPGLEGSIPET